ncbi:nephrin, partial [Taeniopygia guttata]|uniref:nephrin n=1 Tax=Taeniopygia guttata TaxID=59729 RepID=UPI003BB8F2AF
FDLPGQAVLTLAVIGSCGPAPPAPAPPFLEEPANGSALLGEGAELRCRARVGVAVQWARGGLLLGATPTRAHPRYRLAGDPQRGEHHLRIRPVALEDDAAFTCQAGEGNRTHSTRPALLSVLVPPSPPQLELLEGAELPLVGGAEVRVRCHAHDARPAPTLELRLGQEPLPDVASRVFEGSHPKLSSSEATARLTPVPSDHGRLLLCSASNGAGAAPATAGLRLEIAVPPSAPSIQGLPALVRAGEELRLLCLSRGGRPPPSLHWDKNGAPLEGAWSVDEGGVARTRLVFSPAPEDDGAILRCRAVTSLPGGGASASVKLRVTYPPAELTLHGSAALSEGEEGRLSCTSAPSNPPVRLRWWLGGRQLQPSGQGRAPGGGAVSNVTLRGRGQDHGSALVCEAETPGLGTRSVRVAVTVSHPPTALWVEAPPPNATFRVGEGLRLLCLARGGHPAPQLGWSKDGRPLPEAPPQSRSGHVTMRALHVTAAPSDNGADFRCEAGPARSAPVRVRVLWRRGCRSPQAPPPTAGSRRGHGCSSRRRCRCRISQSPAEPGARHWAWPPPPAQRRPLPRPGSGRFRGRFGAVGPCPSPPRELQLERAGEGHHPRFFRAFPAVTGGRSAHRQRHPRRQRRLSGAVPQRRGRGRRRGHAAGAGAPQHRPRPRPGGGGGGGEGQLLCEAQGSPLPPGSVQWARLGDSGAALALPPGLEPQPGGAGGSLRVRGARRDLGGPYECRVDSGVPPPARAVVRLLVTYGPEMEAEPEEGAGPGVVLVPEGAESAELRCRARGVPGVELSWERNGRSLGAGEPGSPFRELQWREGPWSSSVLSVANLSESRARLRRLFHQSHQSSQSSQSSQSPRPRYRYQNVPAAPPDWENWENWEGGNGTVGVFECVAKNERGRARRRVRLRLGDRPDPPRALRLSGVSGTSLSLTWEPGFDGGLPQHFLLRAAGPGAPPPPAAIVTSGWSLTVGGLRPATPYDVTVRARNGRGDSAPARLRAATSAPPPAPPPREEEPEEPPGGVAEGGGAPPALLGALCALGGLLLPALGAGLCCRCHFRFRWGRGWKPAEGAETPSSGSSRGPSGFGSAPKGAEPHLYEEVEPWGEGQVTPEPLVTPEGELV